MKLFSIFMLLFVLGANAKSYPQNYLVSLDLKQCELNTLFQEIWKQTGLRFVYNEKDISHLKPVDIIVNNQSVEKILANLFQNTSLKCSFESDIIYIVPRPANDTPQTKKGMVKLSGSVKDKAGYPLPGIAVSLPGTNIGTTTDIDGNYQLWLIKGSDNEIVYSCIGMKEVVYHFHAEKNTIHDVVLEEDLVELEDVVVIGYGSKSKRDLTSSVSSVSAKDMEKFNNGTATLDNLLGGVLKGVLVQQSSGKPGAASMVNIRGITSPISSSNEPLYVIDGVPFFLTKDDNALNPLLTISPNDIKSIDVLKDAAATAIYGSRGANGVIIVNTVNGRRNQKPAIYAGYTLSIGNPVKKYIPLDRNEFIHLQDQIIRGTLDAVKRGQIMPENLQNRPGFMDQATSGKRKIPYFGVRHKYDEEEMLSFEYDKINPDAFGKANTNWVEETRNKNAVTHQYNAGIRGGSESTNYSFSFNAANQEGTFIGEKMERYGVRLSLDSDISKRFTTGASLNYTYSKRNIGSDLTENGFTQAWIFRPDIPVKNGDGSWGTGNGRLSYGKPGDLVNPVAERKKRNKNNSAQFMGSSYLEYWLAQGLTIRGDVNLSLFDDAGSVFSPTYSTDDFLSVLGEDPNNSLVENQNRLANTSVSFRADYELYAGKHQATFMAGYSWDRTFLEWSKHTYDKFPEDEVLTNASSAGRCTEYRGDKSTSGLNSVFARASYNYGEKYLAEFNFRSDISSKFGPGNKRAYFPALSLGWRISEENFMEKAVCLSDLKFRFSMGQTGSTNVADFTYRQFFTRIDEYTPVLYEGLPGIVPNNTFPNNDIKWEMTTEYNGGIDFAFFDYRLFGSIDAYYRFTAGALAPSPLPLETGANVYQSNLIDMSNQGMEFEIGAHIIRNSKVTWISKFNLSFNRNRVESFNNAEIDPFQLDAYKEGKPVGILLGYQVEKIFQTDAEVTQLNTIAQKKNPDVEFYQEASTGAGDYKYKDLNGDGRITDKDRTIIASPEPKFFGGFLNTVGYKNFNLSVAFQFSHGAKALLDGLASATFGTLGKSIPREMYGKNWTPDNKNSRYARTISEDPSKNSRTSDKYVFSTSYLRLKNISISYSVPQIFLNKLNIRSAMLFASFSNLWTLTKWPGLDPETLSFSRGIAGKTLNEDPYPLSKTFSVGIKLEF